MKQLLIMMVALMLCAAPVQAEDYRQQVADSRAMAGEFMQALKGKLMKGMQEGGPVNAIGVCRQQAPQIAANLVTRTGWDIGRTSLKVRNPHNAPDAWERAVLEEFEQRRLAGEDVAQLEHYAAVSQGEATVFRYMKAIPTAALCVNCHGTVLDPAVVAKLDALYPEDQARGFQAGDIRGAFSFSQPLSIADE